MVLPLVLRTLACFLGASRIRRTGFTSSGGSTGADMFDIIV